MALEHLNQGQLTEKNKFLILLPLNLQSPWASGYYIGQDRFISPLPKVAVHSFKGVCMSPDLEF